MPQQPRWAALLASLSAHVLALFLICVIPDLGWIQDDSVYLSAYAVEPIRLKIPERISYRPNTPKKQSPAQNTTHARASKAARDGTASAPRRFAVPPQLQLPSAAASLTSGPVILQPDFLIQTTPSTIAVPPLAFWAIKTPQRPQPKQLVLPGRTGPPAPKPVLSAPPVLAIPNREPITADISVATAAMHPSPVLPLPPASTMPVRLRDSTAEARTGSIDISEGQAANLIAISPDSMPSNRIVTVPHGLRNLAPSGRGDGARGVGQQADTKLTGASQIPATANSGNSNGTSAAEKAQSRVDESRAESAAKANVANGSAAKQTARSPENHGNSDQPKGALSNSKDAQTAPGRDNRHETNAPSRTDPPGSALPDPRPERQADSKAATAGVTRIEHPANGAFDVIVTQSSPSEDLPEAAGLLSGTPVYMVYLNVGAEREWLLQYCVPARAGSRTNRYEVNADDAAPVSPPYPISTVIPNSVLKQQWIRPILLYGFLTTTGRLRDMSAADAHSTVARQILEVLADWQFRPAMKDKQPIGVEVLLAIPPRT